MGSSFISLDLDMSQISAKLTSIGIQATEELKRSAEEDLLAVMDESLKQVPVETGSLRDSAYIEETDEGIELGYGGRYAKNNPRTGQSTDDYQLAVHERLGINHPQGKAKFLEDPVNDYANRMEESLGQKMKGWFDRV